MAKGFFTLALLLASLAGSMAMPAVEFKRQQSGNAKYPPPFATAPPAMLPQDWRDALNAAVSAGKIPNISPSTITAAGNVNYPGNGNSDPNVCSWTTMKCFGKNDIHAAPPNTWILGFDDGPTAASPDLYNFLASQNQVGTHFLIGSNILTYQSQFQLASKLGHELAVHTWSHQLMTHFTNEEVLGELGWTMQIIYDLSGRVPSSWRPPSGDVDARVRAIAENVFGLTTVLWDAECNDWCLTAQNGTACPGRSPGGSYSSVVDAVNKAIQLPKNSGVILLEHELTPESVGIFKNAWPSIKAAGWTTKGVSDAFNRAWYANAANGQDTPRKVSGILVGETAATTTSSSATSSSTSASSTSSSSASTTTTSVVQSTPSNVVNAIHKSGAAGHFNLGATSIVLTFLAAFAGAALA